MTHEQIAERAYLKYCWRRDRGHQGSAEQDWKEAEEELRILEQISPRFNYFLRKDNDIPFI